MTDKSIPPFEVGDRVVCINDTDYDLRPDERGPKIGDIVTIREIEWSDIYNIWGLCFLEIVNPKHWYAEGFSECCFHATRFRKVESNYSDITAELAQEAIKERVEVDGPIKVLQNN